MRGVHHQSRSIRARLMQIVFTLVVPGAIGFAIFSVSFYEHERDHIAQSTVATAVAIASAVDRDLATLQVAGEILASSASLQSDDLAAFHRKLTQLDPTEFGDNFSLTEPSGRQVLNTLLHNNETPPVRDLRAGQRQVLETRKPSVSDVFIGRVLQRPLTAIDVPVFRDGEVKYIFTIGVLPERLTGLLLRQKLPPNWIVVIVDTSGVIVARTHNPERFVGKKAAPMLLEARAKMPSGMVELQSVEGIPVFSSFARSEVSGWTVAIGIPVAELSHDLNKLLLFGGFSAIGLLVAGLTLATFQSNQIARAMQNLLGPALALGRGEVPNTPRLNVREADDVAQALDQAYQLLQRRTVELDRARQKHKQAQILASMKDEFVANVSHELRTPLTAISGSLGLLAGGAAGSLPKPAARLISIAHNNALRLIRLINDILDIGKIESGKMTFDFRAVDLRAAAEQAIDANGAFAEGHGVLLRLDEASQNCTVRADPDRLMQIFTNLLSNAIKFSPEGGEVVVSLLRSKNKGRLLVRDHGSGIPEVFKPRIFEKFAQAESGNARQQGGTGLGLNIVAKIVAEHDGTVGFEDAPGGGTIFYVELPLWVAKKDHGAAGLIAQDTFTVT